MKSIAGLFIVVSMILFYSPLLSQENAERPEEESTSQETPKHTPEFYPGLSVSTAFELDGAPLLTLGVQGHLWEFLDFTVDLGLPTGQIFHAPWASRYRGMALYPIYRMGGWSLRGASGISTYALDSEYWSGYSVHFIQEIYAGYETPVWGAGLDLGFEPHVSTYVNFKEDYEKMNPSVKEGWYGVWIRGLYYAGVQGHYSVIPNLAVFLKVAYTWPIEDSLNPVDRTILDGRIALGARYRVW